MAMPLSSQCCPENPEPLGFGMTVSPFCGYRTHLMSETCSDNQSRWEAPFIVEGAAGVWVW